MNNIYSVTSNPQYTPKGNSVVYEYVKETNVNTMTIPKMAIRYISLPKEPIMLFTQAWYLIHHGNAGKFWKKQFIRQLEVQIMNW